jgi:hypothetical protein
MSFYHEELLAMYGNIQTIYHTCTPLFGIWIQLGQQSVQIRKGPTNTKTGKIKKNNALFRFRRASNIAEQSSMGQTEVFPLLQATVVIFLADLKSFLSHL